MARHVTCSDACPIGVMKRLAEYYEFYTTQGKIKVDFLFPTVHGLVSYMRLYLVLSLTNITAVSLIKVLSCAFYSRLSCPEVTALSLALPLCNSVK